MVMALAVDGGEGTFPDLREVLSDLEALELSNWLPGKTLNAPDPEAARQILVGIRCPAVVSPFCRSGTLREDARSARFTAAEAELRALAGAVAAQSLQGAAALRAPWLILEIGGLMPETGVVWKSLEERAVQCFQAGDQKGLEDHARQFRAAAARQNNSLLDRVCRSLFDLLRTDNANGVAILTPGAPQDWPPLKSIEAILSDLKSLKLAYWHDTGRAVRLERLGGPSQGEWLERMGRHCAGTDLTDCIGVDAGLPAGSGEVDFRLVKEALGSSAVRVVRASPTGGRSSCIAAVRFLRGIGLC